MSEKDLPRHQAREERGGRESDTRVAREEGSHSIAKRRQGGVASAHLLHRESGEIVEIGGDSVASPGSLRLPTAVHHRHDRNKCFSNSEIEAKQ